MRCCCLIKFALCVLFIVVAVVVDKLDVSCIISCVKYEKSKNPEKNRVHCICIFCVLPFFYFILTFTGGFFFLFVVSILCGTNRFIAVVLRALCLFFHLSLTLKVDLESSFNVGTSHKHTHTHTFTSRRLW